MFRSPGLAILSLLMLALGTGVNTAVFSVAYPLMLRPLPYPGGDRLAQLQVQGPTDASRSQALTPAQYRQLEASDDAPWEQTAAWRYDYSSLSDVVSPRRLTVVSATDTYFDVLGTPAWRGRTFTPEDAAADAPARVVLSYELWLNELGAPSSLNNLTVKMNGVVNEVIGVMPPGWNEPFGAGSLWKVEPATGGANLDDSNRYWSGIVRLKPDVSVASAEAWLEARQSAITLANPSVHAEWTPRLKPLKSLLLGSYQDGLLALSGAGLVVLMVTCANFSGLLLIRASARRHDFAVRLALGARRSRLLRAGLAEAILLSLAGGLAGLLAGWWGVDLLLATVPEGWLPRSQEISLNLPVLAFSVSIAVLTGLVSGLYPAWSAGGARMQDALQTGGRSSDAPSAARLRSFLVVGQLALALVLLTAAALIGRSFLELRQLNPGMQIESMARLGLSINGSDFPDRDARRQYFDTLLTAVDAVPGVASASFTQTMPFQWGIPAAFRIVGAEENVHGLPSAFYDSVGTDFLTTTRIPLLSGRWFNASDGPEKPRVTVISAATARAFLGTENPIGRQLTFANYSGPVALEIIGVVGDVPRTGLGDDTPLQVYAHLPQRPPEFATLLVRGDIAPAALLPAVQRAIWAVNPDQAIADSNTMSDLIKSSLTEPRIYTWLFSVFAGLTLVLAAVGLYALVSFSIGQRTREFGIRMAIGAEPGRIRGQVMREGLRLAVIGVVIGLVAATAVAQALNTMLFSTPPFHPPTYAVVTLVLLVSTALAVLLPARRATRIDPATALRSD